MGLPPVVITRPAAGAHRWVQALEDAGFAACALPLMDIVPEPETDTLRLARAQPARWHALMFVSSNAVRHFFAGARWQSRFGAARAWSPGPGTTAALCKLGWPRTQIDAPASDAAQFDSEHLWAQVAPQVQPGTPVLIVRGGDATGQVAGRDWLARQLDQAGAQVEQLVCYRRVAPRLSRQEQMVLKQATTTASLWLFTSRQSIAHLRAILPAQDWADAYALATHPRIAQAARQAGFGRVELTQPRLPDLLASLHALAQQ